MGYLCHFSSFLIENIFQIELKIQDLRFYVSSDVQPNMPETWPFFISPNSCTEQLFSSVYRDSIFPGLFLQGPRTFCPRTSRDVSGPNHSLFFCTLLHSFSVFFCCCIFNHIFSPQKSKQKKDLQGKNIPFLR